MYPLRRVNFTWTIGNGGSLHAGVICILTNPDVAGKGHSAFFLEKEAGFSRRVCRYHDACDLNLTRTRQLLILLLPKNSSAEHAGKSA